jgi:rhodanese-related sulfurtransferase
MTASRMAEFPKDKLFVVYCAGPHCNGANKAALRLARLGLPVKMMIGGITGWLDEGFSLATEAKGHPEKT